MARPRRAIIRYYKKSQEQGHSIIVKMDVLQYEHVGEDTADPDNPAEPAVDALESDKPLNKQYNFSRTIP